MSQHSPSEREPSERGEANAERAAAGAQAYQQVLMHYCALTEEVGLHLSRGPDGYFPATDCICGQGGAQRGTFALRPGAFNDYRNDWLVPDFIAAAVREKIAREACSDSPSRDAGSKGCANA
jgi:hypothetical protein